MDKYKEIDEIRRIISDNCVSAGEYGIMGSYVSAVEIVNAGYRKLNDDDIVLTKAMQQGSCEGIDDRTLEFFKKHNAEVRKETAKEILQTIWDRFSRKISDEFGDMASDIKYITLDVEEVYDYLLGDLAEEYGVEVDE